MAARKNANSKGQKLTLAALHLAAVLFCDTLNPSVVLLAFEIRYPNPRRPDRAAISILPGFNL